MRALLVLLVVLGALFAIVDRVTVAIVEKEVGDRIAQQADLPGAPEVDIAGFPFLSQAVTGNYDDIRLAFTSDDLGQPAGTRAEIHLRDVDVPLSDVVDGSVQQVPVGRMEGSATLSYALLSEQIGPNTRLEKDEDGLRITRTMEIAGRRVPLSAAGEVSVDGGDLLIHVETASGAGAELPSILVGQVSELLGLRYRLPGLPFGLVIEGVRPEEEGVVVFAQADGTVIGG